MEVKYDNPILKGDAGTKTDGADDQNLRIGDLDPRQVVERTKKRFHRMKDFRKQYDMPWDRWRRYYGGDQWFNKVRPAWKARPTMNYTFTDIETILPIMTDKRPTINIVGEEAKDAVAADLMQDAVRHVFAANEMDVKEILLLKDAHLYGMGVTKQWFNGKTGEIEISNVDTRYFFWSPGALQIQQAEYVGVFFNRWISSVEAEYPKFKGKISAEILGEELTHKPVETVKNYQFENNQVIGDGGQLLSQGAEGTAGAQDDKIVTFGELWSRDEEGQVWVTVIAGDTLLKHIKSPYRSGRPDFKGGSRFPFARCLCYPINSQLVGMGEVAQLESPQDSINRAEAQIADLARLCTSPYMLVPKDARVSLKDITNRIASYIVYNGERPPTWMAPPGVSENLFQIVDSAKKHMDNLSGVFDAARGELPAAKTSGVAIQNLQSATAGRVALKTRMFESYLKEVATQCVYLIQQYYQGKTIKTQDGYVVLNDIVTDQDAVAQLLAENPRPAAMTVTEEAGTTVVVMNDVSESKYNIEIGVGSTLPIDKGVRFDQSLQMYQVKAISRRTLIKDSGRSEQEVDRILKELDQETIDNAKLQGAAQGMAQLAAQSVAPPAPMPQPGAQGAQSAPSAAPQGGQAPPAQPSVNPAETHGLPSEEELQQLEQEVAESHKIHQERLARNGRRR